MPIILAGQNHTVAVAIQRDGVPVPVSGQVKARILSFDGRTVIVPEFDVDPDADGASWDDGIVAVDILGAATESAPVGEHILILTGSFGVKRSSVTIEALFPGTRRSLFIRDLIVDEIRRDRLIAATTSVLADISVTDDYIWNKVQAAEADIAAALRVPLVPTRFFAYQPTGEQVEALDGLAWAIDPAYDYSPEMFRGENWGYIVTRHKPIIDVQHLRLAYPKENTGWVDIPRDWIRVDQKYGHIRIVPSSPAVFITAQTFIMTALTGGHSIPHLMQLEYTAGIQDAATRYPQLLDAVKKSAVLKIVADAFLPTSGSISADGLSQSISVDMEKYQDVIDHTLNGGKGGNGGLMVELHGIRMMVA